MASSEDDRSPADGILTCDALLDAMFAFSVLEGAVGAGAAVRAPTLTELAAAHVGRRQADAEVPRGIRLGELFDLRAAQYSASQTRSAKAIVQARRVFCSRLGENSQVSALDSARIEAALEDVANPVSWNSLFGRLRLVLNWGVREKLVGRSPIEGMRARRVDWKEPAHFGATRVRRILRAAEAHPGTLEGAVGAVLTLGFFAGARTAEIARARWEDVDLEGATLRIPLPKGWTRGARPRLVELEPNAVAWLRLWRDWAAAGSPTGRAAGMVVANPRRLCEWKRKYLAPRGDSWGNDAWHNVMRHTYATMHVGAFRDAAATALNMGHGRDSDILERHYLGLVPKSEARRYWRIAPSGRPVPPPEPPPGRGCRTDLPARRNRSR